MKSFRFKYKSLNNFEYHNIIIDRDNRTYEYFGLSYTQARNDGNLLLQHTPSVDQGRYVLRINAGLRTYSKFLSVYD